MRIFILVILGLFMIPFSPAQAQTICASDQALEDVKFKVHASSNFADLSHGVLDQFMSARQNFVHDTEGPMRAKNSQERNQLLKLISFDDITTPKNARFGDVVFVFAFDPDTNGAPGHMHKVNIGSTQSTTDLNQLVEVRWWAEDQRHVVYNKDWINCAVNTIPMADNALF